MKGRCLPGFLRLQNMDGYLWKYPSIEYESTLFLFSALFTQPQPGAGVLDTVQALGRNGQSCRQGISKKYY